MIRPIIISSCLCVGILHAQPDDSAKPERILRIISVGAPPAPRFETRGDEVTEVAPLPEDSQPTAFSITSGGGTKGSSNHVAWPNRIVEVPNYQGEADLRLVFKRHAIKADPDSAKVHCPLGHLLHPLIIVSRNPGESGWKSPVSKVIDASPDALPARSVLVVNFSNLPLRTNFDGQQGDVPENETKTFQLEPGDQPVRYRVDSVGANDVISTLGNSARGLPGDSRLLVVAVPGPPETPVILRMLADPVTPQPPAKAAP